MSRRYLLVTLLVVAAVGEAVLDSGGFTASSRVIFGALALLALVAAGVWNSTALVKAAGRPVVVMVVALGVLGALSAAWTTGDRGAALRWGLVTIGYGSLIVTSSVVCQRWNGRWVIALLIAGLALVCGLIGLYAATSFIQPTANHTTGFWRPAGTLGYSSALSLLQIAALPTVLLGMAHRNRTIACSAGFAGAVAAISLSLGQARLECTMAVVVCAVAIAFPARTIRSTRAVAVGASMLLAVVAIAAYIVAGLKVSYDAHPHQLARLFGISSICAAATVMWALVRAPGPLSFARSAGMIGVVLTEAAAVAVAAVKGDTSHVVYVLNGGFFHGRLGIWSGALGSAERYLFLGHGADYSLITTPVPLPGDAIADAYDLPLENFVELGLAGLGLTLALYAATVRATWLSRMHRSAWLFGPAALGFLLSDLVDWEWHLAGSGAVWAIAVGALLAPRASLRIYRSGNSSGTRQPRRRRTAHSGTPVQEAVREGLTDLI